MTRNHRVRTGLFAGVVEHRVLIAANGISPQKDWAVNQPAELAQVLLKLLKIQLNFNSSQTGGKKIFLADLIVLGGCAAVEDAAKKAGHEVRVAFAPGRTDATTRRRR